MLQLLVPVAYFNLLHASTKYIHHCISLHSPKVITLKKGPISYLRFSCSTSLPEFLSDIHQCRTKVISLGAYLQIEVI